MLFNDLLNKTKLVQNKCFTKPTKSLCIINYGSMLYDSSALSLKIDKTNDTNHKFDNFMLLMFALIPAATVILTALVFGLINKSCNQSLVTSAHQHISIQRWLSRSWRIISFRWCVYVCAYKFSWKWARMPKYSFFTKANAIIGGISAHHWKMDFQLIIDFQVAIMESLCLNFKYGISKLINASTKTHFTWLKFINFQL